MPISNSALALQMSELLDLWRVRELQFRDWLSGTATGGPFSDGTYPLQSYLEETFYVKSPAALADLVVGPAGGAAAAQAAAEVAQAAAELAQTAAETARDVAATYRDAAQAARDLASNYRDYAASSEANALTYRNASSASAAAALVSEANAATSETNAATSETNAAASAAVAAASAAAADTFDPAHFLSDVNGGWFKTADNQERFFFGANSHTYFRSGANFLWRSADNSSTVAELDVAASKLNLLAKNALQFSDTFLRLNGDSEFTSGVYTPGAFRADGDVLLLGLTTWQSTAPGWRFFETDATADARRWQVDSFGGSFRITSRTDALAAVATPIQIAHAGTITIGGSMIRSASGAFPYYDSSSNSGGKITVSTSAASGTPANGDLWIQRAA